MPSAPVSGGTKPSSASGLLVQRTGQPDCCSWLRSRSAALLHVAGCRSAGLSPVAPSLLTLQRRDCQYCFCSFARRRSSAERDFLPSSLFSTTGDVVEVWRARGGGHLASSTSTSRRSCSVLRRSSSFSTARAISFSSSAYSSPSSMPLSTSCAYFASIASKSSLYFSARIAFCDSLKAACRFVAAAGARAAFADLSASAAAAAADLAAFFP
mmetsp:Transcript_52366/g.125046  ORF Transcript_52366/g.125046 Transcript_52366/m.125046 type:complete len:212 (-) Transcript_52366:154-789(-)